MKQEKLPVFIISGKSPIGASGGGYSTYAYNLARIVKKLGHPLYILALGEKNGEQKTKAGKLILHSAKLPFIKVNIYALPGLPLYSMLFASTILKIVKGHSYNKFIVWGIGPWGLTGSILKLFWGKRVIHLNNYFTTSRHEWSGGVRALKISDYGFFPKFKYLVIYLTAVQYISVLERIVLSTSDLIITNYKSTEKILRREFGTKSSKFYRARFYVQIFKRKVSNSINGNVTKLPKKFILFFSRQDPRKGVNYLLHAMKIMIENGHDTPLYIAGGGDMLPYNKVLAKKLGIEKHVTFLGFVNDPRPLMKKCSVFVFPSIEEGAGALTINEAMEMGLPIVSTACDGIVEDIKDRKSGLLVPLQNPQKMADAIVKLLDHSEMAKRLGLQARKSYENNFSFQNMYFDIKKLLTSVSSKSR